MNPLWKDLPGLESGFQQGLDIFFFPIYNRGDMQQAVMETVGRSERFSDPAAVKGRDE